ncbi:hypothetical protein BgiBS90_035990, partial [Biomphalaria glabrata]
YSGIQVVYIVNLCEQVRQARVDREMTYSLLLNIKFYLTVGRCLRYWVGSSVTPQSTTKGLESPK